MKKKAHRRALERITAECIADIVRDAFAAGSGLTTSPTNVERKALAAAGVTCLLEQLPRAITPQAPAAPVQAEA